MLEVFGHDHISDLRYHLGSLPFTEDHEEMELYELLNQTDNIDLKFHNILLSPGVAPNKGQNPGYALFEITKTKAHNLKLIYLLLEKTYGWETIKPLKEWPFMTLDYAREYGLESLAVEDIHSFKMRLIDNSKMAVHYLVKKLGFDPSDAGQLKRALIFLEYELELINVVGNPLFKNFDISIYICTMQSGLTMNEIQACLQRLVRQ